MKILTGVLESGKTVSSVDPYFTNVQILMHFDGVNNGTTMPDVKGHTTSPNGYTKLSTDYAVTGATSMKLVASNDDYIAVSQVSTEFQLGSGNFTIECFILANNQTGTQTIYSTSRFSRFACGIEAGYLFIFNGAYIPQDASTIVTTGVWHHVAFVRESGQYAIYLGGTRIATSTPGTDPGGDWHARIGDEPFSYAPFDGYIDEFRLTVGICRYSGASITVPSTPFPDA